MGQSFRFDYLDNLVVQLTANLNLQSVRCRESERLRQFAGIGAMIDLVFFIEQLL
jgi:hypothetical protein